MPYSVEHLIEHQGKVLVIQKNGTITSALDQMIEHDFSQLPVVDENGSLLGLITYESVMRAVRSFNTTPDKLSVQDAMVNAPMHYREDNLFDLLDELQFANAVVIVEPAGCVVGMVTSYDASRFLRNRTEDLMHVEDIEFIIKELIKKIQRHKKAASSQDHLESPLPESPAPRTRESGSKNTKAFDELNLGDYINLLMSREIWKYCAPILNVEKESLYELLVKVRQTRNDLAHFRAEISPRSRAELKYCANWLRRRYQDYEKAQAGSFIDTLLKEHQQKELSHVTREEPAPYTFSAEGTAESDAGQSGRAGRYLALANWLTKQKEDQVLLTFEQIGKVIRSPLPASALQLRAWWANERGGYTPARFWLEAGWQVVYVDLGEKQAIFARIKAD